MATKFSCTALAGTNKAGILTPDKNGYYTVVLGAFDFFNQTGAYWPYDKAAALFAESGSFMRRMRTGQARGELGHPRKEVGMTYQDYIARILQIHEDKVTHHIRACWIDKSSIRDKNGRPIIAVMGEVKPSGPHEDMLLKCFKNPDENVAFSVRSLCDQQVVRGRLEKWMQTLITYDYVNEGGISIATKFTSPGLESMMDDLIVTPEVLDRIQADEASRVGLESSGVDIEIIKTELGWSRSQIITLPSMGW